MFDCSKEFDMLHHQLLLVVLNYLSFNSDACSVIRSYVAERLQSVKLNGRESNPTKTSHGVPQGSTEGLMFFALYTSHLAQILDHCAKMREIGWLSIKKRRYLHTSVLHNTIILKKSPHYLHQEIKFRHDVHNKI